MFIEVHEDFTKIMKELVKRDIEFKMWTDSFNGNVGINITGKNGNKVDIAQYMSSTDERETDGRYKCVPIGLSVMYKTKLGRKVFDEGNDVDAFLSDIIAFIGDKANVL